MQMQNVHTASRSGRPPTRKSNEPKSRRPRKEFQEVGARIREKREAFGWSQFEMAKRADVTPGAITQWEVGRTSPSRTTMGRLAKLFGCSIEWLNDGVEKPAVPASPSEAKAVDMIRKVPPEARPYVLQILKKVIDDVKKDTE
jgi:transcriptional regulator with XRE-family HTH domain